jgi:sporulation protein YlmC with PRC-barrel domain
MTQQTQDVLALRGHELRGRDGERIGTIEEIYLDTDSNRPEWALVTTGMFGTKQSFVPIGEATREGDGVRVPFDKATVKDAPMARSRSSTGTMG